MSAKRVLACVGLALLAAGLMVGFLPLKRDGVSCGSAFRASDDAQVADLSSTFTGAGPVTNAVDDCDSARSNWRIPAIVLLIIGAGLTTPAVITPRSEPPSASRPSEPPAA